MDVLTEKLSGGFFSDRFGLTTYGIVLVAHLLLTSLAGIIALRAWWRDKTEQHTQAQPKVQAFCAMLAGIMMIPMVFWQLPLVASGITIFVWVLCWWFSQQPVRITSTFQHLD